MQQLFSNTEPGGKGPSNVASSNPLKVGADGRPFDSSATSAAPAPANTGIDFGEDFARENSSSFYRNASFKRPQAGTSQPPLVLKEIPLTPFEGEIRSYQEFRNRFLEIVEAQRNIEPRHKLMYLVQHLRGAPLRLAEGFPMTDESYFDVTDLLEQRYGDRTSLQNALMQDVIDLPSPEMKREELQNFHDKAFRTIRSLRQLGPGSGPDYLLVQILLGKLPHAMKLKIHDACDLAALDANRLLKGIRDHLSLQERAANCGLNLQNQQQEAKTTLWSKPPGRFNQQSQSRPNERHDSSRAWNDHQFYVADFVDSNTTDRINKAKKPNKCLPSLGGDHGRLSCPRASSAQQLTSRQPCDQQDHLPGGGDGDHNRMAVRSRKGGFLNSLNRRARCDLPADRDVPHAKEQPTAIRVRSAKREAETGNSTNRKTASTKRTASSRGGTPRQTTSTYESSNPQGATAYGDASSLLGYRQTLPADSSSTRTRTMHELSGETQRPSNLHQKDDSLAATDPSTRTMDISDAQAEDEFPSGEMPGTLELVHSLFCIATRRS
ncbi:Pao retrotransposon peptidase family protein-like protein [Aphelenchoides avenae]|nr:Pao retrotransposon peptidase family protein-like protein [Aphelenchus avenae]